MGVSRVNGACDGLATLQQCWLELITPCATSTNQSQGQELLMSESCVISITNLNARQSLNRSHAEHVLDNECLKAHRDWKITENHNN